MTSNVTSQGEYLEPSYNIKVLLKDYREKIAPTDKLDKDDLRPILLGLFGEVGSIMATAKKLHREKKAYAGYQYAAEEEFGDALWYFTTLCRRLEFSVEDILSRGTSGKDYSKEVGAGDLTDAPVRDGAQLSSLDDILLKLGESAAGLFEINNSKENVDTLLRLFAARFPGGSPPGSGVACHRCS